MRPLDSWTGPDGARLAWRMVEGARPDGGLAGRLQVGHDRDQGPGAGRVGAGSAAAAFVRFDYFGHGESSGDFADGTISPLARATRWRC